MNPGLKFLADDSADIVLLILKEFRKHYRQVAKVGGEWDVLISGPDLNFAKEMQLFFDQQGELLEMLYKDKRLKMGIYEELATENTNLSQVARGISSQIDAYSDAPVNAAVRKLLLMEAHHFIPATSFRRSPHLKMIYKSSDNMPAVNLSMLEHRGNWELIEEFSAKSPVGIFRDQATARAANMTRRLNEIEETTTRAAIIRKLKSQGRSDAYIAKLRPKQWDLKIKRAEWSKQETLDYLAAIKRVYDEDYPDVGGGVKLLDAPLTRSVVNGPNNGPRMNTMREWIDSTTRAVTALKP